MASNKFPPIAKMSNDELRRMGMEELIFLLRQIDNDRLNLLREHGNLMRDVNKRMQTHLLEIRSLKDVNQKLQNENQEVRDLACFLDDDRQKGRKLAREWQRFGRYTSSVMKSELTAYQQKLKDLEEKQEEMLKENMELKELCIYLDQELKRYGRSDSIDRDAGDGSSSSSPTGDKVDEAPVSTLLSQPSHYAEPGQPVSMNEQTVQYIRHLEQQVHELEHGQKHPSNIQPEFRKFFSTPQLSQQQEHASQNQVSRPQSVMQAMKVLEVHEQLEAQMGGRDSAMQTDDLDEAEKAIVRQMCNVVWKKLGET